MSEPWEIGWKACHDLYPGHVSPEMARVISRAALAAHAGKPSQIEVLTGYRHIFTAQPGERIVSAINYRGRCLIATDSRILEWNPETETISVLELMTIAPNDAPAIVLASVRVADRYIHG